MKNTRYKALKSEFAFDESVRLSDNSNVLKISATVGMQYPEITENVKAVLLEGFHSGTLNTDGKALNNFCQKAKEMNIPVFLTGACKGFYYESKLKWPGKENEEADNRSEKLAENEKYLTQEVVGATYNITEDNFKDKSKDV